MKKHDLLNDPFYAQLIFVIESTICKVDEQSKAAGVRLTDSCIKYALNRARSITPDQESPPLADIKSRDDFIEELARSIAAGQKVLAEKTEYTVGPRQITVADWLRAISAVRASLKIRRSDEPGSRAYVEFIHGFIRSVKL